MHSAFDVEVYAKSLQDDFRREAERAWRIEEALRRGQVAHGNAGSIVARLLAAMRSSLFGRHAAPAARGGGAVTEPASLPAAVEQPALSSLRPRAPRAAEPYRDMVVIARGAATQPLEEASGVGDR